MTKQEKRKIIKNAYGIFWDKVKNFVDEDGWILKTDYPVIHIMNTQLQVRKNHYRPNCLENLLTL